MTNLIPLKVLQEFLPQEYKFSLHFYEQGSKNVSIHNEKNPVNFTYIDLIEKNGSLYFHSEYLESIYSQLNLTQDLRNQIHKTIQKEL